MCSEFCTEWPSALDSDDKCMKYVPIQIQSKEFVSAGPSLRNPDARIVTLKVSFVKRVFVSCAVIVLVHTITIHFSFYLCNLHIKH